MNNFDDGAERRDEPEDFAEFLRGFLANESGIDPEQLAKVAGIPNTPEAIANLKRQLEAALVASEADTIGGVNWKAAGEQAKQLARTGGLAITEDQRARIETAKQLASLWLDSATTIPAVNTDPKLLTRELWVADALPLFQQLSAPVAERMASALTEVMQKNLPPELGEAAKGAGKFMRAAGGALFAAQLGHAIGKLSQHVQGGSDIGIALFADRAAFVPQNIAEFTNELEVEIDQAYLFVVARELAFARLYKHSRWLRDALIAQIAAYASEISIDDESLRDLAEQADLNNPEDLRRVLESGALIAKRTEEQERALASIETLLALIEGWVEAITEESTKLLPKSQALSEAIRRRRAAGGPAELTFGTLVGLELRPRRQREAAALFRLLGDRLDPAKRDSLWEHPDLLPSGEEIDHPELLIARLTGGSAADGIDDALKDWLSE